MGTCDILDAATSYYLDIDEDIDYDEEPDDDVWDD